MDDRNEPVLNFWVLKLMTEAVNLSDKKNFKILDPLDTRSPTFML